MSRIIYIDAGNTALKIIRDEDLGRKSAECFFHGDYQIAHLLSSLRAEKGHVILANVYQKHLSEQVKDWCLQHDTAFTEATAGTSVAGLHNGYDNPARLGVDRWLAMLAVWQQRQKRFMLVSAGTAVTLDVVDGQGQHLGGLIMPGLKLMQDSLLKQTVGIEECAESPAFEQILQKNTAQAVSSGTVLAVAGMIEKTMQELNMAQSELVLTGGTAEQVAGYLNSDVRLMPDLVLYGLQVLSKVEPAT